MKLKILSDMHIRHGDLQILSAVEQGDEDVVVCAGDMSGDRVSGLDWLRRKFPDKRIVFVPGNHEYYGKTIAEAEFEMREVGDSYGIDVLINKTAEIGGVKFIGTTLWSNFGLYGSAGLSKAMSSAEKWVNDFEYIKVNQTVRLSARYVMQQLWAPAFDFLTGELRDSKTNNIVVVTHFAPCTQSIAKRFAGDPVTPYFVNNHDAIISLAPLWIHGHCHTAFDYQFDGSRVVCNPGGYNRERTGFVPNLIVEV